MRQYAQRGLDYLNQLLEIAERCNNHDRSHQGYVIRRQWRRCSFGASQRCSTHFHRTQRCALVLMLVSIDMQPRSQSRTDGASVLKPQCMVPLDAAGKSLKGRRSTEYMRSTPASSQSSNRTPSRANKAEGSTKSPLCDVMLSQKERLIVQHDEGYLSDGPVHRHHIRSSCSRLPVDTQTHLHAASLDPAHHVRPAVPQEPESRMCAHTSQAVLACATSTSSCVGPVRGLGPGEGARPCSQPHRPHGCSS